MKLDSYEKATLDYWGIRLRDVNDMTILKYVKYKDKLNVLVEFTTNMMRVSEGQSTNFRINPPNLFRRHEAIKNKNHRTAYDWNYKGYMLGFNELD